MGLVGALLAAGAVVDCADAIRLEPGSTPGGPTTTGAGAAGGGGGSAGGGGGGVACKSSADCMAPAGTCDTSLGKCVECLSSADCGAEIGTVCSAGSCQCPTATEIWCNPVEQCVDLQKDARHCGACDHVCYGACIAGKCDGGWEQTSLVDAPSPRAEHIAVWVGDPVFRMFVWGGSTNGSDGLNTGGLYDPVANRWAPTSMINVPSPRLRAAAVWTGTSSNKVVIFGGTHKGQPLGDGAIFNPATNQWEPTLLFTSPRFGHTAVWSGSEMVVFGGRDNSGILGTGFAFNPVSMTVFPLQPLPVALESRERHAAVWDTVAGLMLVYGGVGRTEVNNDQYLPADSVPGGRAAKTTAEGWLVSWDPTPTVARRADHTAVWANVDADPTKSQMIVFGGKSDNDPATAISGGLTYKSPATASSILSSTGAPQEARFRHTAVWLDKQQLMIVWGGRNSQDQLVNTGGVFDATVPTWAPMATGPDARELHTAVSTGDKMIVWGGRTAAFYVATGGVYTHK
jgi:hypothetical protein